MLDERKIKVLKAIINSYILTAEPIGSRTISKEYDLGVSSATIRNEMSDLEDLGYLNKPHTSAGRVPSDKAYRLYVDELMEDEDQESEGDLNNIYRLIKDESDRIEDIIINSSKLLSSITSYTTIAISPQVKREKLRYIKLILIDTREILIVIVTEAGVVKNTLFRVDQAIDQEDLNIISNFLNKNLRGLNIDDINTIMEEEDFAGLIKQKSIIEALIPLINRSLDSTEDIKIYTTGIDKIFNYPEYSSIEKARSFVSFIEDRELLLDLFLNRNFSKGIDISIGQENVVDPLKESSLLTATYKLGDRTIGKLGVIGPTRMDYLTVINALNKFSYTLTDLLSMED